VTGAYILLTAAINSKTSKGRGQSGTGAWKLQAGQGGRYKDCGVPIKRHLSGKNDIGSVVFHALAGPFSASNGKVDFKLQQKTSGASIRPYNAMLTAIALSTYDTNKGKQYDYTPGQSSIMAAVGSTSSSLTAIHDPKGLRKNNFTFSHPIFRPSSPDPQSQSPRNSPAIPVALQFPIEQI
jgi:hypothetical protein